MTREEAINRLRDMITEIHAICDESKHMSEDDRQDMESFDMAIKALEQKPCDDVVSRNVIIQTLNNMDRYVANELKLCDTNNKFPQNEVFVVDDVYEQIVEQLPSVTPTQRWIPVSEGLPEEMGTYMTTIDYGEYGLATGQRYYHGKGLKWNDECVIAWMPLPEPYKAESEV